MKKIFLIVFLIGLFLPLVSLAGGTYTVTDTTQTPPQVYNVTFEGLVPCGRCVNVNPPTTASIEGECGQKTPAGDPIPVGAAINRKWIPCTICHLFVMLDGIMDFILLKIVPLIAVLILMIAGIGFYRGGISPETFNWAKSILTSVIIGLVIIYAAWMIISTTLTAVGVADWVGFGEGWFQISCAIEL